MTKYIILGFSNPNVKDNKADIRYYNDNGFWNNNIKEAKRFDTRALCEDFIKEAALTNCISYGIEV